MGKKPGLLVWLLGAACVENVVLPKEEQPTPGEECTLELGPLGVRPDPTCRVDPPTGGFAPVVEWQWNNNDLVSGYVDIMSTPAVANLTDDDGDGDIDQHDIPDVVFTSFAGGGYTLAGTLTAVSGDGSGTIWSLYQPGGYDVHASAGVAIGDLDADGSPEVCTSGVSIAVICVGADGVFRWAAGTEAYGYGAPAIGDLSGDGRAEVIHGRTWFNAEGTVLASGTAGHGYFFSFPADVDQDGRMEIVAGNTVYRGDGSVLMSDGTPDGWSAIADFDLDGSPEIVHVYPPNVTVTGLDGVVRFTAVVPNGGGGPPTVADFDGDGAPEIGVAGAYEYVVFDTDGAVLWSQPVQDFSSSVTGSSVFDFEGDGAADVVYADEVTLWVYDGATGAVKLQEEGHASGTLYEYPLIVDVDNDGATEIVLASNSYAYSGWSGITVIGDQNNSWRPSRPVWNQYAYAISNVEDDGSIPTTPEPSWTRWNSFRAGGTLDGLSYQLADLVAGTPVMCEEPDGELDEADEDEDGEDGATCANLITLAIPIENRGLADAPNVSVRLIGEDGAVIGNDTLSIAAGQGDWAGPWTVTDDQWGRTATVEIDPEGAVEECDESNVFALGTWWCG